QVVGQRFGGCQQGGAQDLVQDVRTLVAGCDQVVAGGGGVHRHEEDLAAPQDERLGAGADGCPVADARQRVGALALGFVASCCCAFAGIGGQGDLERREGRRRLHLTDE